MSILHYLSKDQDKRAKFIFNSIARIYSYFDNSLQKGFEHSIKALKKEVKIEGLTVLDIGSGTGAWTNKFET